MSTTEVGPLSDDTLARGAAASRDDAASAALNRLQNASVSYEAIPADVRSATCDVVGD
ncbi:MAG TPA: hypothetical protein VK045_01165 [Ornithinicoccus sp.]|nr:hypothetical protein [Ornithinicoccus sp.]